jgi:hypothetical protein
MALHKEWTGTTRYNPEYCGFGAWRLLRKHGNSLIELPFIHKILSIQYCVLFHMLLALLLRLPQEVFRIAVLDRDRESGINLADPKERRCVLAVRQMLLVLTLKRCLLVRLEVLGE